MMPRRSNIERLVAAISVCGCLIVGAAATTEAPGAESSNQETYPVIDVQELVHALREGGYVLYFRHAATETIVEDWDKLDIADCATQRNLSEKGREQARAIGAAFDTFGIKVARILSSPFCRALDTAKLAFGKVEISDDLYFSVYADADKFQLRRLALQTWLATPPPTGSNVVIVSHQHNLEDAVGLSLEVEGTAAVFRPHGDGTFYLVAVMPPEKWIEHAGQERIDSMFAVNPPYASLRRNRRFSGVVRRPLGRACGPARRRQPWC
jgi:broad specificity phosphatase PhoE